MDKRARTYPSVQSRASSNVVNLMIIGQGKLPSIKNKLMPSKYSKAVNPIASSKIKEAVISTNETTALTSISSNLVDLVSDSAAEKARLPSDTHSFNLPRLCIVQNSTLMWIDSNIDESNVDFKYSLTQLRRIVNSINTFTDLNQCLDFVNQIKEEKIFMIVSGTFGQSIMPHLHHLDQINSIYVFCQNNKKHEEWIKEWFKIKGVFTKIHLLCDMLKQDTEQYNRDSIPISVTDSNLSNLDPSFMYSQLLNETLINMSHNEKEKKELVDFCRDKYIHNTYELQIIDEFEDSYHEHTPIWWYTRECFTYQMLNKALRIQDMEIIIKMGFFLRDIHRQIEELHSQMRHDDNTLTVYRGQGMSTIEFEKIRRNQGGLLAFNSFLSTSLNKKVSLAYARHAQNKLDSVGILFHMIINPSTASSPFALLNNVSYYQELENEILFSMNTVFRIDQIKPIEDRLWEVRLRLTSDADDQNLKRLTEHMRNEIQGSTGCHRLGIMSIQMGNFDKAEKIYHILLEETTEDNQKDLGHIYYQLGYIKNKKDDYTQALEFYHKALEIYQELLLPNYSELIATYNNIAGIHKRMGEYSKALEFYEKTLEIGLKSLSSNHSNLATMYNNIGTAHHDMGAYAKALEFYQKALKIREESLPLNHPDFAITLYDLGTVHYNKGEYPIALNFYQKVLEIRTKSLPPNHPDIAITYGDISAVYAITGDYFNALEFYQKKLAIQQNNLSANHPKLAVTYCAIGHMYKGMEQYATACSFYERAIQIAEQSMPENHPSLQVYHQYLTEVRRKCNSL